MAYNYPPSFPVDEIGVIVPILKGKLPGTPEAVHAAWVLVGYGLSQGLPFEPDKMKALSADDAVLCLQAGQAGVIPWGKVIALLLPLILEWIQKQLSEKQGG